jgi:hypothetical protein
MLLESSSLADEDSSMDILLSVEIFLSFCKFERTPVRCSMVSPIFAHRPRALEVNRTCDPFDVSF